VTASWWEQGFVCLDTETTDKEPERAQVASICRAVIDPSSRMSDVRNALIRVEMPADAGAVNGLYTELLMAEGKPPADVLDEFCAEIAASLALGKALVIANAPYDLTVLDRDCARNGVPTISDRLMGAPIAPVVNPIVLDKHVVARRRRVSETQGARCLKTLAQVHGVGWDDDLAHTAEYDALQAGRVVWQLMRRYSYLASLSLAELHEAQVGWYREQSLSLQQFFYRSGNEAERDASRARDDDEREALLAKAEELRQKAEGVRTDWPILLGGAA
jgi:DNA polymerase-3 subunit epsilon